MTWVLVGWAHQIRAELAAIAPARDKTSDGSIGDAAHQRSVSGHNPDDTPGVRAERNDHDGVPEVRAIDIDRDLRVPGLTMQMLVAYLVGRCRAGRERRFIYIIFDGVIWSASSGWVARRYTGSNPHREHAHLSGHPDHDDDRRPFGLAALIREIDVYNESQMKAFPWQYNGRGMPGVPADKSTLWVLGTTYTQTRDALAQLAAIRLTAEATLSKVTADDGDLETILRHVDQLATSLTPPSADEIAEATVRALGQDSPADAAQSLIAVLGPDRAELLVDALAAALGRAPDPAPQTAP